MPWTIDYSDTARTELRRLDRQMSRRVVDYMDERVTTRENPRSIGQALTGPMGGLWRYRVGNCRIVCDIQDEVLHVLVVRVGRRDSVYR